MYHGVINWSASAGYTSDSTQGVLKLFEKDGHAGMMGYHAVANVSSSPNRNILDGFDTASRLALPQTPLLTTSDFPQTIDARSQTPSFTFKLGIPGGSLGTLNMPEDCPALVCISLDIHDPWGLTAETQKDVTYDLTGYLSSVAALGAQYDGSSYGGVWRSAFIGRIIRSSVGAVIKIGVRLRQNATVSESGKDVHVAVTITTSGLFTSLTHNFRAAGWRHIHEPLHAPAPPPYSPAMGSPSPAVSHASSAWSVLGSDQE